MRLTVRCPADGVVEVTIRDLETVVVRSGSDVQATYRCPRCGSPIVVAADLSPAFLAWAGSRIAACGPCAAPVPPQVSRRDPARDEAYIEYFRRELTSVRTTEDILALVDGGERR